MTETRRCWRTWGLLVLAAFAPALDAEDWLQLKFDARHSGDVPDRSVSTPLQLAAAAPLSDGVYSSPVVAEGRVRGSTD